MTTLGHVQRGGAPGAFDRLLATRLARRPSTAWPAASTASWWACSGRGRRTPLAEVVGEPKLMDLGLLKLQKVLAQ